jgi:sarcosine oxidase subunit alpha
MSAASVDGVRIVVDGRSVVVAREQSVAAALLDLDVRAFRIAVHGAPRAPLCGMGICHECRVTIDGVPHRRACLVPVSEGLAVETGAAS